MNTKLKKILIIVIIILILILAGLLIYKFVLKKGGTGQEQTSGQFPSGETGQGTGTGQEGQGNGQITPQPTLKIRAISQEAVYSPTIAVDKSWVVYYLRSNGTIWQSNFDGANLYQVSNNTLENLADVLWSPNKDKTITIFQDGTGGIVKYYYDLSNNNALPLNKYIQDMAWSFDGKKIVYWYYNQSTNNNTISISNPDGSNYSIVLKTRLKDLLVNWPKGTEVYFQEKPSGLVPSSLYSLNPLSKTFGEVLSNIYGLSVKWSADGSKILYSQTAANGKSINLLIANRNGSNPKSLSIATFVEKCAWSQDLRYIYCAIPKNITEAEVLPDDFYKGTFLANDDFFKINIDTGEKTKILEDSQMTEIYDADDLFLSLDESYLFFVNKTNGLLYSIKL